MYDKVAVYAGTRNIYEQMYVCLKSLLLNNDMDRVYLLIEDDTFPYPLPDCVMIANVSEQEFFEKDSPNYQSHWSYMSMMRCALATMFPEEKRMLWLDCDTIVDKDITDLFQMNMAGAFYAGVLEPKKSIDVFRYINCGVLMCNLELLRLAEKEDELVQFLNMVKLVFPDQEAINLLCQCRIRLIDSSYNSNPWTMPCQIPKVIHYATIRGDDLKKQWAYKKYDKMSLFKDDDRNG